MYLERSSRRYLYSLSIEKLSRSVGGVEDVYLKTEWRYPKLGGARSSSNEQYNNNTGSDLMLHAPI